MSIYTYDAEPRCEWCEFASEVSGKIKCLKGFDVENCTAFKYDVFKRKPLQSPKLRKYDPDEFEI